MITVLGGALVTLIPTSDETVLRVLPGGSAFNIATGAARQGFPTALMAKLSRDGFGQMLRRFAERSGVDLSAAPEADEPTAIALMPADRTGNNRHVSLYIDGTASREWSSAELALIPTATTVLHIGSAVHWPAPVRARILRLADRLRRCGVLVSIDLNLRPEITVSRAGTAGHRRVLAEAGARTGRRRSRRQWRTGCSGFRIRGAPSAVPSGRADNASGAGRANRARRISAEDALTAGLLAALHQLKLEERRSL